jgi:hypothetical protein
MAKYYVKVTLEWEDEIEADNLSDAEDIALEIADREGEWYFESEEITDDDDEEDED